MLHYTAVCNYKCVQVVGGKVSGEFAETGLWWAGLMDMADCQLCCTAAPAYVCAWGSCLKR